MINIIIQKYKEQWRSIIYYLVGLVGYAWMMIGFFPQMQKIDMNAYLQQMPEDFIKFFSAGQEIDYSHIEGFLSLEYLSLFFVLIIVFFLGSSAGSTIAGSIEKRTMDFQLSQPISRTKLVLAESITGLINTLILVGSTSVSIYLICQAYNLEISGKGLMAFTIVATAFLWAIYSIALLLSSILSTKISVVIGTVVITFGFYIFTSLANLIEKLKDYEKLSLFYMYKPQEILSAASVEWEHVAILIVLMLAASLGALAIFNRRDI